MWVIPVVLSFITGKKAWGWKSVKDKFVVNFTPTGLLPKKGQNPYVPINPGEIVADVKAAWECGITVVHLHVRDEKTEEKK